ncbi:MAG: rRNA maturation RNase YbeY [Pseudorhodoplanes sp.]|nr:Endoribonuclease YbeY [Pseudorhodoplanes sp.]MBW7948854.1 rRNA maturation RNase YbeY [Pseudorhodoplanes sp.]MCL4712362.1 rRNA maturation RNase YbeY [Pseudorhodoplanes sp.]MCQ3942104.1 rRNA maturation RNase YbeY [Alphaproteobacteria bacterium]GIK79950.1 MAG: endoribonuclease YbeY [Alphaproteobacteria bacterium]
MTPAADNASETVPVDVVIECDLWTAHERIADTVRGAITAAARMLPHAHGSVVVALTDDRAIRALNRAWRGKDKATNVLSFPVPAAANPPGLRHLGDIAIAYETTTREAAAEDKIFAHHVAHLAVHGFLHLLGYDHETDAQAEDMERLERAVLARLEIPDPYARPPAETLTSHA